MPDVQFKNQPWPLSMDVLPFEVNVFFPFPELTTWGGNGFDPLVCIYLHRRLYLEQPVCPLGRVRQLEANFSLNSNTA